MREEEENNGDDKLREQKEEGSFSAIEDPFVSGYVVSKCLDDAVPLVNHGHVPV